MLKTTRLSQRLARIEYPRKTSRTESVPAFEIEMATTRQDRRQAACLVGRVYQTEGYLPSPLPAKRQDTDAVGPEAQPFYSFQHLLPEATVFVAKEGGQVVGTLSVILDSPAGLPLEALYSAEVAGLRGAGRRVSEICSLAIDPHREKNTSWLFLNLFKQATAYLVHCTTATDVLVTLKPSHQGFYASRMGFKPFGSWKQDARFGNADTVAMGLTREQVEEVARPDALHARANRIQALVFGPLPEADLRRLQATTRERTLTAEELLERLEKGRELFVSALPHQKEYLRRSYGNRLAKQRQLFEECETLEEAASPAPLLLAMAVS